MFKINRRKVCFWSVLAVGCIVLGIGFLWKLDGIYRIYNKYRDEFERKQEYQEMHEKLVDIEPLSPLTEEENGWYTRYHFISHAGGGDRWKGIYQFL